MARTKQTARRATEEEIRQRVEFKRRRDEEVRRRDEEVRRRNHIHVIFDSEKIRTYFAPTALEGTFRYDMEITIVESIDSVLSGTEWEYEGDKRVLITNLKRALGGRLYSRNIIDKWCEEGLLIKVDE